MIKERYIVIMKSLQGEVKFLTGSIVCEPQGMTGCDSLTDSKVWMEEVDGGMGCALGQFILTIQALEISGAFFMFTGIIEETGKIISVSAGRIAIQAEKVLEGTKIGDSIAVNGVCLTVTTMTSSQFTADVMPETLSRSSLGSLSKGDGVNLERAMAADGRFGGHIVSGHIDGTGTISRMENDGNAVWVYIAAPGSILNLIIEKGSIAIDGISLTVAKVNDKEFAVSVIPHTGKETTLLGKKAGDIVNLENDVIGKYVQKLMGLGGAGGSASQAEKDSKLMDWLRG